jgi:hypothetical protein
MYKLLRNTARLVGTILGEMDSNFLAVCNALVKMANPELTLKGYADNANEPSAPAVNDCYLVLEAGTIWELTVEANEIICWNGSAWELLPFKITELNTAFQAFYFDAENIAFDPPQGMEATNVQEALEELATAVFGENGGSGSNAGS